MSAPSPRPWLWIAAMLWALSPDIAAAHGGASGGTGSGHSGLSSGHDESAAHHHRGFGGWDDDMGYREPAWDPWVLEIEHPRPADPAPKRVKPDRSVHGSDGCVPLIAGPCAGKLDVPKR